MILSADATREARREALEAGADAFVPKPVEALQLLEEVRSLAAGQGAAPREEPAAGRVAAQAAPAAPPAVVNRDALGRLEELSSAPGFVAKVADIFCADAAALLGRMEKAVSGREFGEFRSQLHAMKGSSASMGAVRLSRLCGVLGRHSDAELQLQGPGLLRALTEEFEQARGELERYVREQRRSAS
jgi:two-component system sensor histidine kinase RpfC